MLTIPGQTACSCSLNEHADLVQFCLLVFLRNELSLTISSVELHRCLGTLTISSV